MRPVSFHFSINADALAPLFISEYIAEAFGLPGWMVLLASDESLHDIGCFLFAISIFMIISFVFFIAIKPK
jgi:hypothetical protein